MDSSCSSSAQASEPGEVTVCDRPLRPPSFAEVKGFSMADLRSLCRRHEIVYSGRVTKQDLVEVVCNFFGLSTSGNGRQQPDGTAESKEKAALPDDIRQAYAKLPSFTHITSGWSVTALCRMPHFTLEAVHDYLLNSPDKEYDGESLRAYKSLRAYQLCDERHIHDLELNLWEKGTDFYFVRGKCWPSQDTSRNAYKCIVCIDRTRPRCYGAHCRCVSGLGQACSHVAGLLYALEDFCSRGYRSLQGPSVTEKICRWSKPSAQKVEAQPLAQLPLEKASAAGRKRKRWTRTGISKYDPRHPADRQIDQLAVKKVKLGLLDTVGDCGFLRHLYDTEKRDTSASAPSGSKALPDTVAFDDFALLPCGEVTVETVEEEATVVQLATLIGERIDLLYSSAGVAAILDDEPETTENIKDALARVKGALRLSEEARKSLEETTRGQSNNPQWMVERVGRITASMVHQVITHRPSTKPDRLVSMILKYDASPKTLREDDPRQHGRVTESIAREAYLACCDHTVEVTECGLFVHPDVPYLAASPDGIVADDTEDTHGLLEIKCPVATLPVSELAGEKKNFFLMMGDDGLHLKTHHQYHSQVQMQMAVTGLSWTDFVVFTSTDNGPSVFVQRIRFSSEFWAASLSSIVFFYEHYVVLEVRTRRVKRNKQLVPR